MSVTHKADIVPESSEADPFFILSFALVVLAPYSVDIVDLARSKRSVFGIKGKRSADGSEEWSERRVVP